MSYVEGYVLPLLKPVIPINAPVDGGCLSKTLVITPISVMFSLTTYLPDRSNILYEPFLDLKKTNNTNDVNHERTFILNTQEKRIKACKNKYEINSTIKDKICILIDDSIVRGTTLKFLINYIKSFNPKEIHFISASPSIKYPCFYGVDFADIEDLYFNKANLDLQTTTYLDIDNMDSLTYLSLDNLSIVFNEFNTNKNICTACFDGNYLF